MPLRISLVHQFEHHQSETWALAFSPDGKQLVSSDGRAVYLWRLDEEGKWSYEQSFPFSRATSPCFSPHGDMLAFRGTEEVIRLIAVDGREIATFPCRTGFDCAFSPDGRWLVAGDATSNIVLWDLRTYHAMVIPVRFPRLGEQPRESESGLVHETVRGFRFTPDGQRLVLLADSEDGYLHICYFDPTDTSLQRQKTFPHGSMDVAISPDGKRLAAIVPNKTVYARQEGMYLYDLESLHRLHVFPQNRGEEYILLAFSPDSHYMASSRGDGRVDIFSLDDFDRRAQLAAHPGLFSNPIGGLDWSKTGYIATGGANVFEKDMHKTDYTIKIWRVDEV